MRGVAAAVKMSLTNQSEEAIPYNQLSTTPYHYQHVWRRAVYRIKMQKAMHWVSDEILKYGTSTPFIDQNHNYKLNLEELMWKKIHKLEGFRSTANQAGIRMPWYVLNPESSFCRGWNFVMSLLLVYTAILMPVRVAFFETVYFDSWTILELCVDALFLVDVVINCFLSYNGKDGAMETSLKKVFCTYLRSWFIVDIVACVPFSLIEYGQNPDDTSHGHKYNQLVRLARLPRLYKLLRVFRVVKALKRYSNSRYFELVQDFLHMNSRTV
jgi:hypothetical protein